jgi:hypothetical protein
MGQENIDLVENIIIDINNGENNKLLSAKLLGLALKGGVWEFQMEVNLK